MSHYNKSKNALVENKSIINGYSYEINGILYISVWGSPRDRGYAYGFYSAKDFKKIKDMLIYNCYETTGHPWDYYIDASNKYFKNNIKNKFHEFYEEMEGITEGCIDAGVETSIDEIIAWNNVITIMEYWHPEQDSPGAKIAMATSKEGGGNGAKDRCSAFIATGDYTTDGRIVVAHNSFCDFLDGQYFRLVLDIAPEKGHRFVMQTRACSIWSGTDFFVTDHGIIGTETTIGGFLAYEHNDPISCRIRKAMQYGETMDDYVDILLKGNSGDYANAWLFGDIRTNEIMRFELGLKYWDVKKTTNGYFYGCNFAFSPEIRNLECANTGYCDVRRHQGARQVRIPDLVEKYKGKLNISTAKIIIADHYDVYLNKINPCSRTICSHYELDPREYMSDPSRPKPFTPKGAIDGAVADYDSISKVGFYLKFGSSCNVGFNSHKFCNKHRQWKQLEPYLNDRPSQPWTFVTVGMKLKSSNKNISTKRVYVISAPKTSKRKSIHRIQTPYNTVKRKHRKRATI